VSTVNVNRVVDASGGVLAPISSVMRNRIINGSCTIDQRNAGASVTPAAGTYTLDRWRSGMSQDSKYTVEQTVTGVAAPAGFTDYLAVTSLSSLSLSASDFFRQEQFIEGFNIADLGWGTANAKTVTLSFWVRSSLTGTFGGSLVNSANARSYPFSYTISAANTWEQKSVTIPGDTTGTWLTTNGIGIRVYFGLGVGSTFSGTAGAWATGNFLSATGATSVVSTNNATWYVTGVQLEVGTQATSFEYRQYQQELALCQRYFSLNAPGSGVSSSTTQMAAPVTTIVSMRAAPTATLVNGTNKAGQFGVAFRNITAIVAFEGATVNGGNITSTISTTTSGVGHMYYGEAFGFSAEL